MENMMGLLRIKVVRGINLAVRDVWSSDPYTIVRMGKQIGAPFSLFVCFDSIEAPFLLLLCSDRLEIEKSLYN
ncbi:Protein C2-DOMAIN ABA-RELATED 2 [Linum perenne]